MRRDWLHWIFEASLLLKGILAAMEALSGLGLLLLSHGWITDLATQLTAHELSRHGQDVLSRALAHASQAFSGNVQHFYAFYFLSHGGLKLAIVVLLARGLMWAYPLSVVLMLAFICYQTHLWLLDHSPVMLILTLFDVLVIALTCREWVRKRGLPFVTGRT